VHSKEEINNIVWKACDTFRGTIDATQYKDYILTMLFLKYVTDVWKDKKSAYVEKYNGDELRIERALRNERFQVPEGSTFDHLFDNRNEPNIGELINISLEKLEDANRSKLERVFRNIDFNSEANLGQTKDRNRRLKNLLVDFSVLNLQPSHLEGSDIIGDAYEYLIARFASDAGKKAGEFYTPSEVSTLLAKLMNPQPGNRISDPACGSGSLLIKVAKEVGNNNFSLYGQENNGSTWALARMNMFLHEMDNATIEWGDTLNNPRLLEGDQLRKFDIVVANPPFSLDKWGAENATADQFNRFHRGVPPKSKGDYAFITHMIETTYEDTGRVGVVVPHGVLFRGSSEGKIRKQLIEENLLEAVIGLPSNLFFGTGIPAVIVIFNKAKAVTSAPLSHRNNESGIEQSRNAHETENTEVLFIDASKEFESGKNQNNLRSEDIGKIVATYQLFKNDERGVMSYELLEQSCDWKVEDEYLVHIPSNGKLLKSELGFITQNSSFIIPKYAYRASIDEIEENDYNLNIPRYVDTFEEEEPVDIPATQKEIARLKSELAEVELEMEKYLKEILNG